VTTRVESRTSAVARRGLELGRGELGRVRALVVRLARRLGVELGQAGRLAAELGERLRPGVVLEEPERDQAGDEEGERDRGEEEERQPDAERAEHLGRRLRLPGRCSARG
jgi:hypothetical protein